MGNRDDSEIGAKGGQKKRASDENEGHKNAALRDGNRMALTWWSVCSGHPESPLRKCAIQVSVTSVHENVLAGDVAGSLRNEKENHVRDFFRLGHAFSQRNFGNNP